MALPTSLAPRLAGVDGREIAIDDTSLESAFALARPRLLRIARLAGVALGHCDDVVQDTLLIAWQRRAHLRNHNRLDAWLDSICRNLCRHYHRGLARERSRLLPLAELAAIPDDAGTALELPDTQTPDPLSELERADQKRLLERALSHLSPPAREVLELCYLAETPQREAAERQGLSLSALEAQLHRARRRLRRVLETDLRLEAEALGWFPAGIPISGWREARQWCHFCGKHRLLGSFLPLPNGNLELRMRCPSCCRPDESFLNASDALQLRHAHSFGPAMKRLFQFGHHHFVVPLQQNTPQRCYDCSQPVFVRVRHYAELPLDVAPLLRQHYSVTYSCSTCGILADASAAVALMPHPAISAFIAQHPRYRIEPEREVEYQGRRTIAFRFAASLSTAQLHIFADRHSLEVLETLTA